MFEGEPDGRRNTDSIDNVRIFKQRQSRLHIMLINLRCGQQQVIGELAPDHSGNLGKLATRRNAVEPLHQCVTQRLRNP